MSCVDSLFDTLGEKAVKVTKSIVKSGCKLVTKTAKLSFNACKLGLQGLKTVFNLFKTGFENLARNLAADVVDCKEYKIFQTICDLQTKNYELIRKNQERIQISDNLSVEEIAYLVEDVRKILYIEEQSINERKLYHEILTDELVALGQKIISMDISTLENNKIKILIEDMERFFETMKVNEEEAIALVYALHNKTYDSSLVITEAIVENAFKKLKTIMANLEEKIGSCQNKIFIEEDKTVFCVNKVNESKNIVPEVEKIKIKR